MSVRHVASLAELRAFTTQPKLTVVDFFATWCGPCKNIAPVLEKLSVQKPHVNFCKVDVDHAAEIMKEYPVKCMPTFYFFKSGSIVDTLEGADPNTLGSKITNNEVIPPPPIPSDEELEQMRPRDLLALMRQHHMNTTGLMEKSELIEMIKKYR